jgi:hypothetical protein
MKFELEPYDIKVHYFLPPSMNTTHLDLLKKKAPLITKCFMKNNTGVTPEYAASLLLRGISMGQFIIIGTWMSGIMQSLKGSSMNLITQIILAPLAIVLRRISDYKVRKAFF